MELGKWIFLIMAYILSTERLTKDFNQALHLHFQGSVGNYNATKWDASIGSNTVDDTNGGVKDSIISSFKTSWENDGVYNWVFTKHASNPLIWRAYSSYREFYPPCIIQESATDYKILGKVNGEGEAYNSADGVSFTYDSKFLSKGTAGQWDEIQASPNLLRKVGSTYYCFYSGYSDAGTPNHKIGLATVGSWAAFSKDAGNPILTVAPYNTANSTNYDGISISDAVLVGTTWYFFGHVYNNAFTSCDLVYGVGSLGGSISAVVLDTKIASLSQIHNDWGWMQSPSVFKHPTTGKWMMTFTLGRLIQDTSTDNQALYCFASQRTDAPVFTIDDFICKPIMTPDTTKDYENNYNYAANWLKDNEGNLITVGGKYRMYYSGHENTAGYVYTGCTCLGEASTIPQI